MDFDCYVIDYESITYYHITILPLFSLCIEIIKQRGNIIIMMQIFLHIYILCIIFFNRIFKASSIKLWSLDQDIACRIKNLYAYIYIYFFLIKYLYFIVVIIISFPCNEDTFLSYFIFIWTPLIETSLVYLNYNISIVTSYISLYVKFKSFCGIT